VAVQPRLHGPTTGHDPVVGRTFFGSACSLVACSLLASTALLSACAADTGPEPRSDADYVEPEPLLHGKAQRKQLCARAHQDPISDLMCNGDPKITSFTDLRQALGLLTGLEPGRDTSYDFDGFALTAHSTSLVTRAVSAINPRIIFIRPPRGDREMVMLAFARGEQFSEAIVRDRASGELIFYLTTFTQACNDAAGGCTPGDLLTEVADVGWRNVDVYDEQDLANTTLDCLPCHQPGGPGTTKILRMQEIDPPWSHWFYRYTNGGYALVEDHMAAKGEEAFVSIPGASLKISNPGLLSSTVRNAGGTQPNVFASADIEREVLESAAEEGGSQPYDNSIPGQSDTWNAIYARARRGEAIPVPYLDVKVTDPQKLDAMTQAYVDYRKGRLAREELPDIRDVFPDDPKRLARMGFATEPGLDGRGVLLQACSQCHNGKLDQTVSRSRFGVDLDTLGRKEKDRAIERLLLPADDPRHMPPARLRTLSDEAKQRLIDLLRR